MLDIRLDFIQNIAPEFMQKMCELRREYICLDAMIQEYSKVAGDETTDPVALRAIALARTHLETSLQYSIKSLCILGEEIKVNANG